MVHPVHSAAIDYISGRADSLAFAFSAGAWLLVLRARIAKARWLKGFFILWRRLPECWRFAPVKSLVFGYSFFWSTLSPSPGTSAKSEDHDDRLLRSGAWRIR
jgi:hypothetical protein